MNLPSVQIACPPRTVLAWNVSILPSLAAALSHDESTLNAARIGPLLASQVFQFDTFL